MNLVDHLDPDALLKQALEQFRAENKLEEDSDLPISAVESIAEAAVCMVYEKVFAPLGLAPEDIPDEMFTSGARLLAEIRMQLYRSGTVVVPPPPYQPESEMES